MSEDSSMKIDIRSDAAWEGTGMLMRPVASLTLHPAAALIPPAAAPEAPSEPASPEYMLPLEILADGQILVSRERYERAQAERRSQVATLLVTVPKENIELYILERALASQYLTDDQRACLAVEYADRLSARMRKARASKAAAIRHGKLSDAPRTTGATKQDARESACRSFRISPKKFRQVRKLRAGQADLYKQVLHGVTPLKGARDAAKGERVAWEEVNRRAAAPTAATSELILGDALQVIPTLPDGHFTALVTDPPYGINFCQEWRGPAEIMVAGDGDVTEAIDLFRRVLEATDPKLRKDALLLTFVPAKYEPEFREVVTDLGWTIIGHLVWIKNTRVLFPHLNIASQHERLILAVRGNARLRRSISDVFRHGKTHHSSHPCEKPVDLLQELIEALTVKGEAVLDPLAGSGSTVVAAKGLGRQATGIEIDERWYAEARQRLNRTFPPELPSSCCLAPW